MKATKIPPVTETKTVEIEPAKIVLELSEVEAKCLGAMIGGIREQEMIENCLYAAYGLNLAESEIPRRFNHTIYNKIIEAVKGR